MRIIAGRSKGRRLAGPAGTGTRPMTDRAREALFSSLGRRIEGASVLDLFAGSGSLGLEALSRGAARAVFVDSGRKAVAAIRRNIEAVGLGGAVEVGDVSTYLIGCRDQFDLVFVDPPFDLGEEDLADVMRLVATVLTPGATVVVHRRHGGPEPAVPERLTLVDRRRYGDSELWRYEVEET